MGFAEHGVAEAGDGAFAGGAVSGGAEERKLRAVKFDAHGELLLGRGGEVQALEYLGRDGVLGKGADAALDVAEELGEFLLGGGVHEFLDEEMAVEGLGEGRDLGGALGVHRVALLGGAVLEQSLDDAAALVVVGEIRHLAVACFEDGDDERALVGGGELLDAESLPEADDLLDEREVGLLERLLLVGPLLLLLARGGDVLGSVGVLLRGCAAGARGGRVAAAGLALRELVPVGLLGGVAAAAALSLALLAELAERLLALLRGLGGGQRVAAADGLHAVRAHAGVELGLAAGRALLRRTAARGFHRARHGGVWEDETRDGRGTGAEPRVGDGARRTMRGGATMRVLRRGVCR